MVGSNYITIFELKLIVILPEIPLTQKERYLQLIRGYTAIKDLLGDTLDILLLADVSINGFIYPKQSIYR